MSEKDSEVRAEPLTPRIFWNGRHYTMWCYKDFPSGMRYARPSDLWFGQIVLSCCLSGVPGHLDCWHSDVIREDNIDVYRYRMEHGIAVYVKRE